MHGPARKGYGGALGERGDGRTRTPFGRSTLTVWFPYHALGHERFEDSRHVLLGVLARRVGEEERCLAHAAVTFDSGERRGRRGSNR